MTRAYYNENDPYAAQWLSNLIAAGHIAAGIVDERSIVDVEPSDLEGFTQCHFFAGIGGWSYALRLAGWPDDRPVWTGSCPCQPFSSAARGRNTRRNDERHLWPIWRHLISECSPSVVFGEQTSNAGDWLDGVCDDMEEMDYSIGAAVLPASSVGFDHARHRIYFACYANGNCEPRLQVNAQTSWMQRDSGDPGRMGAKDGVSNRVGRLRAYGNAIVPPLAARFIEATMT